MTRPGPSGAIHHFLRWRILARLRPRRLRLRKPRRHFRFITKDLVAGHEAPRMRGGPTFLSAVARWRSSAEHALPSSDGCWKRFRFLA